MLGHCFEPYRLPDAAHGGVPDALGAVHLLAARLVAVVGRIPYANPDVVGTLFQGRRDVELERRIAARVAAYADAVHPDVGFPVYGAEVQQHALAVPFRGYREAVVVPEFVILTQAFPYAREARLHGERHEDLSLEFVGGLSYGQDRIVPQAVEVLPVAAYHLRTRVFGQYVLRIELFAPLGTDTVARGLPLRYAGKGRHQGGSGQENVFLHTSGYY